MNSKWYFAPPVVFIVLLFVLWLLNKLLVRISFRAKSQEHGTRESYACGEDNYDHMAQPDYSNFFPYAFFFTLAHVATLIMATVPAQSRQAFVMVFMYIGGAAIGLYILFRR